MSGKFPNRHPRNARDADAHLSQLDDDYLMRLIEARCGDDVAAAVVPMSVFEKVLDAIKQIEDRVDQLEQRIEAST